MRCPMAASSASFLFFFPYTIDADSAQGAPALQRDWRSVWSVYFAVDKGKGAAMGEVFGCPEVVVCSLVNIYFEIS